MDIEKTACTCTTCHTEVPATPAVKKTAPDEVAGGLILCLIMIGLWILVGFLLEYLNGDLDN